MFLVSNIDPDYFSFYYIGQGVKDGFGMYRDFADNKGPILYLFFTLINLLFGSDYLTSLILVSTFIDSFTLFFIFRITRLLTKADFPQGLISKILAIFLSVLLFKSFSVGSFFGGFYSENLALLMLSISTFAILKQKYFLAGVLFSLSFLTRLSFLYFALFQLFLSLKYFSIRNYSKYFLGISLVSLTVLIYLLLTNNLEAFYQNTVVFNINYISATKQFFLVSLTNLLALEKHLVFIFSLIFFLFVYILINGVYSKLLIILLGCSLLATLTGGLVYLHHFQQLLFFIFVALGVSTTLLSKRVLYFAIIFLFFSLSFNYKNYLYYAEKKEQKQFWNFKEVRDKRYLQVINYDPKFYLYFSKNAPDRYYQPFFVSSLYNKSHSDITKHQMLDPDRVKQTAFLEISIGDSRNPATQEYFTLFGDKFNLSKVASYQYSNKRLNIYYSN